MSETAADQDLKRRTATAGAAADRQSDRAARDRDDDAPDRNDTTSILYGAAAIKGSMIAGRMAVADGTFTLYAETKKRHDAQEAAAARELALLAEWGARRTVIAGVEMTNAEAQEARQHVIDHGDRYADWAVQRGHIRADEKDEFKAAIRRKKDLEEKRGRGTLTDAEAQEGDMLNRSRAGKAADAATADQYRLRGAAPALAGTKASTADVRGNAGILDEYALFKATAPAPATRADAAIPVAPTVRATGLDL